jgi:hypothetical protein
MIDLSTENLISLREAPRHLPTRPNGKRVHISAVYRWVSRGVRGVKLEALKIGGSTYTSVEALQRFGDRLTGDTLEQPPAAQATPRQREREIEQAAEAVQRQLGLGNSAAPSSAYHRERQEVK